MKWPPLYGSYTVNYRNNEMKSAHELDKKEVAIVQSKIANSLIELANLLDISIIEDFDIKNIAVEDIESEALFLKDDKIKEALKINPILQSSLIDIKLKEKGVKIAKAEHYPSFNFDYSFGSNYYHIQGQEDLVVNQETQLYEDNGFWTQLNNNMTHYLGFSLSIPIFNRFHTNANVDKAKVDKEISELEYQNQKKELANKIKVAYNEMLVAKETYETSKEALGFQEEAFNIVQEKYKEGLLTSYEFLESKLKYTQAQSELIKAKYELIFKRKVLSFYMPDRV